MPIPRAARILQVVFALAWATAPGITRAQNAEQLETPTLSDCVKIFRNLPFRFPDEGTTYVLDPAKIRFILPETPAAPSNFKENLQLLKKEMDRNGIASPKDGIVLYPMSGFDLTTPLALFPDARRYVLIDVNRAAPPVSLRDIIENGIQINITDINGAWIHFNETAAQALYQNLLASLRESRPDAQIRKVHFYRDPLDMISMQVTWEEPATKSQKELLFASGDLGHLQGTLMNPAFRPWWKSVLDDEQPVALVIKGSQSVLRPTFIDSDVGFKIRESFLDGFFKRGGIIAEGASKTKKDGDNFLSHRLPEGRTRWELTDGDPRFDHPEKEFTMEVPFSYSGKVRVSQYGAGLQQVPAPETFIRFEHLRELNKASSGK